MLLQRLRTASGLLALIPSLMWGLAYLAAIPAFAAIYAVFPVDFYQTTTLYEPSVRSDKKDVESALAASIYNNFINKHGRKAVGQGKNRISVDDLSVSIAPPLLPESSVNFRIQLSDLQAEASLGYSDYADPQVHVYRLNVRGTGAAAEHPAITFPCPVMDIIGRPAFQEHEACLVLDKVTNTKVNAYLAAIRGFPSADTTSHFWRMLYFSAVTISTLGYGDIVPVTPRARGWVTAEIVLGPVLFGLFLNALVRESRRTSQP